MSRGLVVKLPTSKIPLFEVLLPVVVLAFLFLIKDLDFFRHLEYISTDWRFSARTQSEPKPDERFVILGVTGKCVKDMGRWPWPMDEQAKILYAISRFNPKVVLIDDLYSEPSQADHDEQFIEAALHCNYLVTGAMLDVEEELDGPNPPIEDLGYTLPLPLENFDGDIQALDGAELAWLPTSDLRNASFFGFSDVTPSRIDGIRRKLPLVVRVDEQIFPSTVLQTMLSYYDSSIEQVQVELDEYLRFPAGEEEISIPIDEKGRMWINYRSEGSFNAHRLSVTAREYTDFLTNNQPIDPKIPDIENKIVVIGRIAVGLSDMGPTPLKGRSPLVIAQANAINSILKKDYYHPFPDHWLAVLWLLFCWGTLFLLNERSIYASATVPIVITGVYIAMTFYYFETRSLHLSMAWPALGFLAVHAAVNIRGWLLESQAKGRIKELFGTYLAPAVVEQMIGSGRDPSLGGRHVQISAFFSDVQGFSAFSEVLKAGELVDLMNDYLSEMTEILFEEEGTLDKFIGDAIVGFFGAPQSMDDHALRACRTAARMQRRQAELREKWKYENRDWPDLVFRMQTRIGIHTGNAVVGNMGSHTRFNYTMMGDTVNLAARCESGAKNFGVYTMVTAATRSAALQDSDEIIFRYIDKIVVKGRSQPMEMYEIVCHREQLNPSIENLLKHWSTGMEHYLAQNWDKAKDCFNMSMRFEPNQPGVTPGVTDNPSMIFAARCDRMKANPPGEKWDGVYIMTTK